SRSDGHHTATFHQRATFRAALRRRSKIIAAVGTATGGSLNSPTPPAPEPEKGRHACRPRDQPRRDTEQPICRPTARRGPRPPVEAQLLPPRVRNDGISRIVYKEPSPRDVILQGRGRRSHNKGQATAHRTQSAYNMVRGVFDCCVASETP